MTATKTGKSAWAEAVQVADGDGSITVVLADADERRRAELCEALRGDGFTVVAEAGSAEEAFRSALEHRPQLCLVDVSIPGGGITAAERIFGELPETKIAILSEEGRGADLVDAIHAGAKGYLVKANPPDRLTPAVRALARGEAVLPRALTSRLVAELRWIGLVGELRWVGPNSPDPKGKRRHYPSRFTHHYRRRRDSGMSRFAAWRSTRARMREYRQTSR